MTKKKSGESKHQHHAAEQQQPLSGSKKVKNQNHTRKAPHEGS